MASIKKPILNLSCEGLFPQNISGGEGPLWDPAPENFTKLVPPLFHLDNPLRDPNASQSLDLGGAPSSPISITASSVQRMMGGGGSRNDSLYSALRTFAQRVSDKMSQLTLGEPEDQLRAPFEAFMRDVEKEFGLRIVCTGETRLPGRTGKPDYAIHVDEMLAGYVELKAPGKGALTRRFVGHDRKQWNQFTVIPNILYTDGNEWGLYRDGKLIGKVAGISGDIVSEGNKAVRREDVDGIAMLLMDFLQWQPIVPCASDGKLDMKKFASLLAPLCRKLRDDVADALKDPSSPLVKLASDWRELLFPGASDKQFADAYAQTVTFALLLAKDDVEGAFDLESAERALKSEHMLLSRALQVLTDEQALQEISSTLDILTRVIGSMPRASMGHQEDLWLYFYENFLAEYDPELRKNAGAYYTPVEVVRAQVRLIDNVLTERFGKALGFADSNVVTLDPATGTGTYLLGVIDHALKKIEDRQGAGAVAAQASSLAKNLYGFEIMTGPFAVAELRVTRALQDKGAIFVSGGTQIYLTDTLESPNTPQMNLPYFLQPIADQHRKALAVKDQVPILVCLGNPPYDRHGASKAKNKARTGNWVRWGDDGKGATAILKDFTDPASAAGHGMHLKNLYNLYVYFWRWALWKVFEHSTKNDSGIVSFITASSYIDGDAFSGMREHMRKVSDEILIIDLGGEGRGTRKSANVFAIQTPVAIAIAIRDKHHDDDTPARVRYAKIEGDRDKKLSVLDSIRSFDDLSWSDCPKDWQAPFKPEGKGSYFDWPDIKNLMPWQHSGVQLKRTWPISFERDVLKRRWKGLLTAKDKAAALRETGLRKVDKTCAPLPGHKQGKPIAELSARTPAPPIERYAYRSFDRQWLLADNRLGDRFRPDLWAAHGAQQLYLTSLLSHPLGNGPALTATAYIPDLHHFRGSYGAKEVIPLYRDSQAKEANVHSLLLDRLQQAYSRKVTAETFYAYAYGVLAHPAFTAMHSTELATRELRLPLTKDSDLFAQTSEVGAKLLWLHTYGERFVPKGKHPGQVPNGDARFTKAVSVDPDAYPKTYSYDRKKLTLRIGDGEVAPVAQAVFAFEVSGLKVVESWLKYRMKNGAGKKSSPLDNIRPTRWTSDIASELLDLLWVLEATLAMYPTQASLLSQIVNGPYFKDEDFPAPDTSLQKPPDRTKQRSMF